MTARVAQLEQGIRVTLRMFGFSGLLGGPVSQLGVASVVATLPRTKGPKGYAHDEAW